MKVLFTHRYFWPDTPPYAAMLRMIAEHFANAGNEAHVFASQPSYGSSEMAPRRERLGGLQVARVSAFPEDKGNLLARVCNVIIYCLALFWNILRQRADVVTASTFPPVAAGWTASLAARLARSRFVYHMQDVHPEVSLYAGGAMGRGIAFRMMRWLDTQTLRRADAIVVLSQDMADTVAARMPDRRLPLRIINNFQLDSFDKPADPPADLVKHEGVRRIVFAGNMGRFQNLPVLVEGCAAYLDDHPDAELLLLGDGEAKPGLVERWAGHSRIRFAPFLPYAQAEPLIREADVGLVSLAPDIYRVSYPSKVLTYIGLGLPMLALVEPDSALAREIVEHELGAVPRAATPDAIAAALTTMLPADEPRRLVARYHAAVSNREAVLARWDAVFAELIDNASPLHEADPMARAVQSERTPQ
jgi:colanic acid biosynthesis glycosyl transferase WcaI